MRILGGSELEYRWLLNLRIFTLLWAAQFHAQFDAIAPRMKNKLASTQVEILAAQAQRAISRRVEASGFFPGGCAPTVNYEARVDAVEGDSSSRSRVRLQNSRWLETTYSLESFVLAADKVSLSGY